MMKLSMIVFVVFMVSFSSEGYAFSRLKLESSPGTIHPILAKSLQITCTVQNEDWKAFTTQTPSLSHNSSAQHELLWNDTVEGGESPEPASSVSAGKADFSKLLSLVVTKQNPQTGLNETIASVVGCNIPVIEKGYAGAVKVVGNTEDSPRNGEQGYIQITWDRPVDQHAGLFACEANALNSDKHSVSLSASLNVEAVEPEISDLIKYISTNDRYISDLKSRVFEIYEENIILKNQARSLVQENADILSRLEEIKSPIFQSGSATCNYQAVVNFDRAFNKTPLVFTAIASFGNAGSISLTTQSVTNTSFTSSCSSSGWPISYNWLAIEN